MLAVQFDYNVGSTPEGLDLAFGLTMAIVVRHPLATDCTDLAHGRKQPERQESDRQHPVPMWQVLWACRVTDLACISVLVALIVPLSQLSG